MKRDRTLVFAIAMMVVTVSFFALVGGTSIVKENGTIPPDAVGASDPATGWTVEEMDTPIGLSGFNFERWGGWWSDAEKIPGDDGIGNPAPDNVGEEDDLLCWAATASNMMEFTGWGFVDGMDTSDEMLDYFEAHVTDEGSKILYGLMWWDMGFLPDPGDRWASEDVEGGGFWTSMLGFTYYDEDTSQCLKNIEVYTASNRACGIEIDEINGDGVHAITAWGVTIDDTIENINDPARYKGVWVTDSDSHKGDLYAEDYLRYFNVTWSGDNNYWYMPNYGGGWSITSVTGLALFPGDTRPVADIFIGSDQEEGRDVILSGDFSYDNDDDQLSYRWDFDGNGTWDTEWSTESTIAHVWEDEYSGTVYLQVFDGRLTDMCSIDVNVVNVDPDVSLSGDLVIDENSVSTITVGVIDPGTLDTFVVEVDWNDGTVITLDIGADIESFVVDHRYLDDDPTGTPYDEYVVVVRIWDNDGGYGSSRRSVWVDNVPPEVTIDSVVKPNPYFILPLVHEVEFFATYSDIGYLDTHRADWFWGDMTSDSVDLGEGGYGPITGSHIWSVPGTYKVMLFVVDDDTEQCSAEWTIIVVSAQDAIGIVDDYIQSLPSTAFGKNPKTVLNIKKALDNMAMEMIEMIDDGDHNGALNTMVHSFEPKMDGLPTYKNHDWVINNTDQNNLCEMLDDIKEYLYLLI